MFDWIFDVTDGIKNKGVSHREYHHSSSSDIGTTVKPVLSGHSKNMTKIGFQDRLSLNAGQKYCRMEHSAILTTFIKLPFAIKIFVLSILEWTLKTGFTVPTFC